MSERPLVSVIMGVRYTRADTALLERAVRSVLYQTYSNLELLVCDDGSTAAARVLLEQLAGEDRRVKLIRDGECLDLAVKLNRCLSEAAGEYIARMDDDDFSYPNRLEKQIRFLEEHNDISFVGCNVELVRDGEDTGERKLPQRPRVEDFYVTQPYIHPSLLFRAAALRAVGGYSESRGCLLCEDYDLLLRMYARGMQGANLQEVLLDYTVPSSPKGNRRMKHRFNEARTRYKRFRELGRMPQALPYVVKPIATGLLPGWFLRSLKKRKYDTHS